MRYTKNYKLKQPEADDYVLVEDFNENSDTVDGLIKKIESVIGDLENSEEKDSLIKLIETLQKNKADLGKDGKVVPEQLPEVDLSGIENSITELESNALKLGETSTTAYVGDKGKVAYDHSQKAHANPNAITEYAAKLLITREINKEINSVSGSGYFAFKIGNYVIAVCETNSNYITLPSGYRPRRNVTYKGEGNLNSGEIYVSTDGSVSLDRDSSHPWPALYVVSFEI